MKRYIWTIPLLAIVVLIPATIVLAASGSGGFDGVVNSIESQYHTHATRIPFMSLISLVAGAATEEGVRGLHVAEFEHFDDAVDGQELKQMIDKKLGPEWQLMIRETHRGGGEQTLIYCHPEGRHMGLFILDKDHGELNVVQLSVDPDHLNDSIAKYGHNRWQKNSDEAADD